MCFQRLQTKWDSNLKIENKGTLALKYKVNIFANGEVTDLADVIDVYEAMDMFLPGMFAYRSILAGNIPMEIPNLRDPEVRELWRNDTACTMPNFAGDMLLPTSSLGTPEIDDSVYDRVRALWMEASEKNK